MAVIRPTRRLRFLLRFCVVGLLLFSVLIRPVYSTWCETHQLGHELAALAHEQFRPDSAAERQLDAEHARGGHGLLHSDDGGVYAVVATVVSVPVVHFDSVLNAPVLELPDPVQRLTEPFRPPIA